MTELTKDLTAHDIRELRSKIHHLKPVVIIGNKGLTDSVLEEINRALDAHELIKIRSLASAGEELTSIANEICKKTNSALIQTIGHIVAIYREVISEEEDEE